MQSVRIVCKWASCLLLLYHTLCFGTSIVIVVSATGDYVVVATDSRNAALGKALPNDDACKVIALDDTLFLNSGTVVIGAIRGKLWDSLSEARKVYRMARTRDAERMSIDWGNRAMSWFYTQSRADIESITDPDGGLVTGGFINFDSQKRPVIFSQQVFFISSSRQLSRKPWVVEQGKIGVSGVGTDLVKEFEKAETVRARNAYGTLGLHKVTTDLAYDIQFAPKAVQFVIDNVEGKDKEFVHGPIDVVVLQRFVGVGWIRRKQNCYAMDVNPAKKKPTPKTR